ncbi:MAG TPA: hypothetical protein VFX96_20505 [Pyrinomonadaceae bacterium]|nr:hypothetical protein [Pyrinomonadaceae bacterium]
MNRKLIRTTLAEVKGRGESHHPHQSGGGGRDRGEPSRGGAPGRGGSGGGGPREHSRESSGGGAGSQSSGPMGRKKIPPAETSAEIFYYKKQMDAHTLMVIVLQDGEEVVGTIEWYDRSALKINRRGEPNVMLLKHNIKYMFKAEDRDGGGDDDDDDDGGEEESDD